MPINECRVLTERPALPSSTQRVGISAIAIHEPARKLANRWFGERMARKFVHHTGTESRGISSDDEVTMGLQAVEQLRRETACDLRDCAALVFVSPSFVPRSMACKYLHGASRLRENLRLAAKQLVTQLGIANCPRYGINWFCSGYAKALSMVRRRIVPSLELHQKQFILVVTAGRISRITDYACGQTGPLFGDMATATLLSPLDSSKHPVRFELKHAFARKLPAPGVFFNFDLRQNVLSPAENDGVDHNPQRLVFTLDGMGIADIAPRAMSSAVAHALECKKLRAENVRFVVPHQAGAGIVRLTGMKLEQLGLKAEVINGITGQVGNVSSSSIPYALKHAWDRLDGLIACPTAAVGDPGEAEASQGCILLKAGNRQSLRQAA